MTSGGGAQPSGGAAARHDTAMHLGVASCGSSTCHGRQEATGPRVRQNELMTWQDPASLTGAHARAWSVLAGARGQAIARRLGIGNPQASAECIACHGDPAPNRGPGFVQADGVGCEACHGAASGRWLASHAAVSASHADNVAGGMRAVNEAGVRAALCLDCHFGSAKPGQFVTHRIMAAGHPRLSFELDLFTSLQSHHDEDGDYAARKTVVPGIKAWAVGQALAVSRALRLYPARSGGAFPEFYFFDCRSCHRTFSDDLKVDIAGRTNPGRPVPPGSVVWNDESLIMLAAAAKVAAPGLAGELEARSRAFHLALTGDRQQAVAAAAALAATAERLAAQFERQRFDRAQGFAMIEAVLVGDAARLTDYQGGAQAVMAADTLIASLARDGAMTRAQMDAMRPALDRAYLASVDANRWEAGALRAALAGVAARVRALK
ncbi:multiheme c-type cytochrome [Polymorphobacter sp.]|uniref:multiheme c-type cytochrome n=1 Tax=Polymorphobacter sp. TaxID=1909290 RepID=UPI003F717B39